MNCGKLLWGASQRTAKWVGAMTFLVIGLVVSTGALAQAAKLRVGVQSIPPDDVFQARNWLKPYGLTADIVPFSSGGDMLQAFIADRLDIADGGSARLVSLAAHQPNLFYIVAVRQHGGDRYGLMVPKNSPAKNIQQLKGKKIGVVTGSGAYGTFRLYLQKNGLGEKDFQLVNMKVQDMQSALQQGIIDAALAWEPQVAIAETAGTAKRITSMKGINESPDFVLVNRRFADAHPDVVSRFLAADRDEANFIKQNPSEAGRLAAASIKKRGVNIDPRALSLALTRINVDPQITGAMIEELVPIAQSMKAAHKIPAVPNFQAMVNTSFYQRALKIQPQQGMK